MAPSPPLAPVMMNVPFMLCSARLGSLKRATTIRIQEKSKVMKVSRLITQSPTGKRTPSRDLVRREEQQWNFCQRRGKYRSDHHSAMSRSFIYVPDQEVLRKCNLFKTIKSGGSSRGFTPETLPEPTQIRDFQYHSSTIVFQKR